MKKSYLISIIVFAAIMIAALLLYPRLAADYEENATVSLELPTESTTQAPSTETLDTADSTTQAPATEIEQAPDFTVLAWDGSEDTLASHFGRPLVVNFWATWCSPCASELPAFDALYKTYGDRVDFMMVNLTDGSRDTVTSVTDYVKSAGYTFPVFFDTTYAAAITYGAQSIPLTIFFTDDGQVAGSHLGPMSESTLKNYLEALLELCGE